MNDQEFEGDGNVIALLDEWLLMGVGSFLTSKNYYLEFADSNAKHNNYCIFNL